MPGGERLEEIFRQLDRFRLSGFNGPEALQPGTVRDWIQVSGRPVSRQEIRILFDMDAAYLAAVHRETTPAADDDS